VLRRSTTLWTWASALIKVARSAFNFMVSFLPGSGPRFWPLNGGEASESQPRL
jgi:hypothetical protein